MKNKLNSGIGLLLMSNAVMLSSFLLNIFWSNYIHGGGYPVFMDITLRLLYLIAAGLAFLGIRNAISYKKMNEKGIGKLALSFFLAVLPALIIVGQVWGLIKQIMS